MSLLAVESLSKHFPLRGHRDVTIPAVDDVTLTIPAGASFGVAGESGSGKTTLARLVLMLEDPTDGSIRFDGTDLTTLDDATRRPLRRRVQAVFQDVGSSLNPRMRVRDIVAEPLEVWKDRPPADEVDRRVVEALGSVGLGAQVLRSFPHQLSGGQRQRVAIARSLVVDPDLIVLDEPVSALDVSVRSQVLNLLLDLRADRGLTYLLIAHDLALLRHATTHIAIMYLGRIVEMGPTEDVFADPVHPYTKALLASVPQPDPTRRRSEPAVSGEIGAAHAIEGCRFHPRCPHAIASCMSEVPALVPVDAGSSHVVACPVMLGP